MAPVATLRAPVGRDLSHTFRPNLSYSAEHRKRGKSPTVINIG
jgi:hypothetical protein